MLIHKIIGNIYSDTQKWSNYTIDYLELAWYELAKRILRKHTNNNQEIGIKFEANSCSMSDGDILAIVDTTLVVVKVKPDECIALIANNSYELAKMCYEIGNRHAPLFIDENNSQRLLLPKDKPLQLLLQKMGFEPILTIAKLTKPLSTISANHEHEHKH
ncbi:MAG: hypothetical protein RL017_735 [Pseudomonadota bacterium]|jgi:urease accessory protein|nr:hypothetical protein [Burkholderiales bacterium]